MIILQFSFDLPENRIQEFLEYSSNVLRRTWEGLGCRSYTAYRSVSERIRRDQVIRDNEIVEQLVFESMKDVKRFLDEANLKPEETEAAESYGKIFHAANLQCRILEEVIGR